MIAEYAGLIIAVIGVVLEVSALSPEAKRLGNGLFFAGIILDCVWFHANLHAATHL